VRWATVNDDSLPWKIAVLRGELLELGSAVRQLNKSGLDNAAAQLLVVRKCAELARRPNEASKAQLKLRIS
jgi:hypothetical protein